MVIRPEAIRGRLKKLREMLAKLEKIKARGEGAYMSDELLQSAAERGLQIAAQCVMDIGNHIIAEMSLPLPGDNEEIAVTLQEAGVISAELAARLAGLGGFRNILVYDYMSVDQGRIFHEHLQRLDDLRDFAAEIVQFLDQVGQGPPQQTNVGLGSEP